jgi:hypothetical protein
MPLTNVAAKMSRNEKLLAQIFIPLKQGGCASSG